MSALTKVFERQPVPANELGQVSAKADWEGQARTSAAKTPGGS
jgi:hypothetical protein